mmetsp:Transcript_17988/g.61289  ORF Transcript_17988/g.61289 Transcript_17988/m.61289 type:complete len:984 (-) Transcript_17988:169-3120(-)
MMAARAVAWPQGGARPRHPRRGVVRRRAAGPPPPAPVQQPQLASLRGPRAHPPRGLLARRVRSAETRAHPAAGAAAGGDAPEEPPLGLPPKAWVSGRARLEDRLGAPTRGVVPRAVAAPREAGVDAGAGGEGGEEEGGGEEEEAAAASEEEAATPALKTRKRGKGQGFSRRRAAPASASPSPASAAIAADPTTAVGPTTCVADPEDPREAWVMPPCKLPGMQSSVEGLSDTELVDSDAVYNHELSWLQFNWRVLAMAVDPTTPALERLRFLAITGRNLDEFFAKRYGAIKRQEAAGVENLLKRRSALAWTPKQQLTLIASAVQDMVQKQTATLQGQVLPALARTGVELVMHDRLTAAEQACAREWFCENLEPILTPLAVDPGHPFPVLPSLTLSLAVTLHDPHDDENSPERFAIVSLPTNYERFVALRSLVPKAPSAGAEDGVHELQQRPANDFITLEQLIEANLDRLFNGMIITGVHPFRVTRNADLERNEEEAEDLLEMISVEVRARRFAPFVRLEVEASMPPTVVSRLAAHLGLDAKDVYPNEGVLGIGDFDGLKVDFGMDDTLEYPHWAPLTHPRLLKASKNPSSVFSEIRTGDVLVQHPYHSFASSTQLFVHAAANDPKVVALKATLYRTSSDSPIIASLLKAAEAGKQVSVLVELKARFDEARNVGFARKLERAGANVAYGLVGLKTHCKLALVVRQEEDRLRTYVHVGTGNYNPRTAAVYTDFGMFTCDEEIGQDAHDLFKYLTGYHRQQTYRKLLVAPNAMRAEFIKMIDNEIKNAQAGKPASVTVKVNGLDDKALVSKLYEAGMAGVRVDCVVRGICMLRPGVKGLSDNIRVVSVVGRFLEHHRVFRFENGGEPLYYMGSADWMARNLTRRVEAAVPVTDPRAKAQLAAVLDAALSDSVTAWEMRPTGDYVRPAPGAAAHTPIDGETHAPASRARKEGLHAAFMVATRKENKAAKKRDLEKDKANVKLKTDRTV